MYGILKLLLQSVGLDQDDIDRQFAIGKKVFELPVEEKLKYRADLEHGNYNGYRPRVSMSIKSTSIRFNADSPLSDIQGMQETFPNMRDNFEMYNVFKFSKSLPRRSTFATSNLN